MRQSDKSQWRITQGKARALIRAASYPAALERGAAIGFRDPDSVCLVENTEAMRAKAIAAWPTLSRFGDATPTAA